MYSATLLKSRKARATKTSKPQEEVQYTAESMSVSIYRNELLNSVPRYHMGQTSSTDPKAVNYIQSIKSDVATVAISNEKCKGNEAMMSTYKDDDDLYEALYN